jgi:hypothetical protein
LIVHGRDGSHRVAANGVRCQFEPLPKPLDIETLFAARSSAAPEIEIEESRQLVWCGGPNDLSTGFESVVPDQLMQRFWRKVRYNSRKVRRIQEARERTSEGASFLGFTRALKDTGSGRFGRALGLGRAAPTTTRAFRHGLAIIRVSSLKKQS